MTKVKARSVEYRLACFCDTSAKVYATAVYLKQSSIEFYYITLISIFKDQAGPIKNNSPWLKLLAVLIGVRGSEP